MIRFSLLIVVISLFSLATAAFEPTWESLDARELPDWYDQAKFGIFLHWGVFSVPAYVTAWFEERWLLSKYGDFIEFVEKTERRNFAYADYAERFDATLYDPRAWVELFSSEVGAQYVVLTSKHHEGFCNWDSRSIPSTWNWNSVDVGPRRDLVGELSQVVKNSTSPFTNKPLKWGVYHSMYEWFNPAYIQDKGQGFVHSKFPQSKTIPELVDLVKKYKPELIWSDGAQEAHSDYWSSKEFLAWYAKEIPTAVWNDRWGNDTKCHHGMYRTCTDRYQPHELLPYKWEDATAVDTNAWEWSRVSDYRHYIPASTLLHDMVETVAFNGNYLLNVGPKADGTIDVMLVDRLRTIGKWMKVNGEAIYATRPWAVKQKEGSVYYTTKNGNLYAILTNWPRGSELILQSPQATNNSRVFMLGLESEKLLWFPLHRTRKSGLRIVLPLLTPDRLPCDHAWTLVLTKVSNYEELPL